MDVATCDADVVLFLSYSKGLPDGRQCAKVKYLLGEILLPCLLAVIAGTGTITDIAKLTSLRPVSAVLGWHAET